MGSKATEPAERLRALVETIDYHAYRYHALDDPEITDVEYDALMRELEALEAAHPELISPQSPTQRVGAAALPGFREVSHRVPMLSLANAFEEQEIRDFDRRVRERLEAEQVAYTVEPKLTDWPPA